MPLADETALGLLETHGLVAGIEAADAMLKTADVRLVSMERTIPALITIKIVGDVASVQASVDAGRAAAERVGRVVSAHVIPRPADEVRAMMKLDAEPARAGASSATRAARTATARSSATAAPPELAPQSSRAPTASPSPTKPAAASSGRKKTPAAKAERAVDAMTVRELRALAREIPEFPLQGREVARARKEELLELLRKHGGA